MTAAVTPAARTGEAARHRVFFALWGTERFCQRLAAAAAPMLAAVPGRPVVPADWHVTLCFLGAVDEQVLQLLRSRAGQLRAREFVLQFDGIEYWRQARVIAATAATAAAAAAVPQPARDLAAALRGLARSAGLEPDERPLQPHVTLMRGVPAAAWRDFCAGAAPSTGMAAAGPAAPTCRAALGQGGLAELTLEAHELHLAESRPPADGPADGPTAPPGRGVAGWPGGPRRYATLARWPLRP